MHFLDFNVGQMVGQRLSVSYTNLRSSLNSEIRAFLGQLMEETKYLILGMFQKA